MSKVTVLERDYAATYDKWVTLGPLVEKFGMTVKGYTVHPLREVSELAVKFGVMNSGAAGGRPGRSPLLGGWRTPCSRCPERATADSR